MNNIIMDEPQDPDKSDQYSDQQEPELSGEQPIAEAEKEQTIQLEHLIPPIKQDDFDPLKVVLIRNTLVILSEEISENQTEKFRDKTILNVFAPFLVVVREKAFADFHSIKVVYAPMLKYAHQGAFLNCYSLINVVASLKTVKDAAFKECLSLCRIDLSNAKHLGDSFFNSGLIQVTNRKCTKLADGCFLSCECLQSLDFEVLTKMDDYSVGDCTNLKYLRLPACAVDDMEGYSVTRDTHASWLKDLKNTVVERIPEIQLQFRAEKKDFLFMKNLIAEKRDLLQKAKQDVTIKSDDLKLDQNKKDEVVQKPEETEPNNEGQEDQKADKNEQAEKNEPNQKPSLLNAVCGRTLFMLEIQNVQKSIMGVLLSTTTIPDDTFKNHNLLMFAHCPNCHTVGKGAFQACYSLKTFFSKSLKTVHDSGFYGCVSLSKLNLHLVEDLGENAVAFCQALVEVDLQKLKILKAKTFESCWGMRQIVADNLELIEEDAALDMPDVVVVAENGVENKSKLEIRQVKERFQEISEDGEFYERKGFIKQILIIKDLQLALAKYKSFMSFKVE